MAGYDTGTAGLRDIFLLLRRKLRLILMTMAIAIGLAAIYVASATPLYTASALLLIDPSSKNLLDPGETTNPNIRGADAFIESEVEILRSNATALAAIEDANLLADPEFGPSLGLRDKILQAVGIGSSDDRTGRQLLNATLSRVKDALTVKRQGLTYVISVSVTSESPDRAAALANTFAKVYIEQQVDSKVAASLSARDVLKAQLDTAQQNLARSEDALASYIDDNLDRLAEESGSAEVAALRSQLLQARTSRAQFQETLETSQKALQTGDWQTLTASLESEALAALANQRQRLARQLGQAEDGSQAAIDLRAELSQLEEQLQLEGTSGVRQLQSSISETRRIGEGTRESIRRALLSTDLTAATLSEIYALQQEASIARNQYDTLLARMRGLEAQSLVEVADSRIVSEALPPSSASYPDARLILALTLIGSLGLGVGLAFLNEYYVGGITSEHQLAAVIPAPVAATIPGITPQRDQVSVADTILDQPMSSFAEGFRRLRASIDKRFSPVEERGMIVMVTSAEPAEGKSTIALSLARTYAMSGKRVILIDADMRKPSLHKYIGVDPERGLLDYLLDDTQTVGLDGFYVADRTSELGVILGNRRSDVPTDQILQSERFTGLVTKARESFDVIVIDTPPLLPVVDTRYVAPLADCTVLCVRFDETGQTDLRKSYEQLEDALPNADTVVSVLNFQEVTTRGYRYGGYYGYSDET